MSKNEQVKGIVDKIDSLFSQLDEMLSNKGIDTECISSLVSKITRMMTGHRLPFCIKHPKVYIDFGPDMAPTVHLDSHQSTININKYALSLSTDDSEPILTGSYMVNNRGVMVKHFDSVFNLSHDSLEIENCSAFDVTLTGSLERSLLQVHINDSYHQITTFRKYGQRDCKPLYCPELALTSSLSNQIPDIQVSGLSQVTCDVTPFEEHLFNPQSLLIDRDLSSESFSVEYRRDGVKQSYLTPDYFAYNGEIIDYATHNSFDDI